MHCEIQSRSLACTDSAGLHIHSAPVLSDNAVLCASGDGAPACHLSKCGGAKLLSTGICDDFCECQIRPLHAWTMQASISILL